MPFTYHQFASLSIQFLLRCGDNATVKERMLISSTKDTLVKKLEGANPHQASDQQELEYKEVCDSISKGKAKWN